MKAILTVIRRHPLSVCCYVVFLLLWLNFFRARIHYHGLYDQSGALDARPMQYAFYSLVFVAGAAIVLGLIAFAKLLFGKTEKSYYACYFSIIIFQMVLLLIFCVL